MKKILYTLSSITLLLFLVVGCDDTSEVFNVTDNPTAPSLADVSITKVELDPVNTSNPAITFNWASAEYGQQASIVYDVEFSKDQAFTEPIIAASISGQNTITLSMGELNTAAGNAGLNPFEWADVYVRVVSSLGSQKDSKANSNSITLNLFPFFNYVFSDFYLVGNATAADWNNNNNNPALFRDPSDENLFTYTGEFGGGQFKVLETKGLWQPQWGTNGGDKIEVNPGGGDDPNTFPAAGSDLTAGKYTFTINFATNKFSFEPFDASGISAPSDLTLTGSSLDTDVTMTALAFDGNIWYANGVRLKPGDLQFTANGGSTTFGGDTSFSGTATDGGSGIPVIVEDDYDVWYNGLTNQYILIPLNL